ncbi:helix-turn-helix transcriptional regulator [Arhodomonas sp. SL1]|uniref:helix-turn-helix transcriptional regulator n=1 Tax=Arhodomonas sp. SL1 TaxID=3425691 RepID=UPI003F8818B3
MARTERIYRLHALLRDSRHPVPFQRLREHLEVSDATIKRDIQFLRDQLDAPLAYDPEANGYHYDEADGPFELPGLWLNHSELYALLASEQLLEAVQPGVLRDRIGPLRGRIRRLLGDSVTDAEEFARRVRIDRVTSRATPGEAFTPAADATLSRRQLAFTYHARARDEVSRRRVHPQQLLHYRGNWYLSAWCTDREALRIFSLDRIREAAILDEPTRDLDTDDHDRYLRASFGIFTGTAESWAVLRFSPHAARWVADEHWHPDQIGQWTADGGWELQVPYSDPTELIQEVLRHGPDAEVVAPQTLRRHVANKLHRAVAQYC